MQCKTNLVEKEEIVAVHRDFEVRRGLASSAEKRKTGASILTGGAARVAA